MEETVKQRLISFIKLKGLSVKRFETLIGASNGFVNNISKSIGAAKLHNISNKFPDLNPAWLLTGDGEMLRQDNVVMLPAAISGGIPFYDRAIECGTPADFNACIEADKADGRIMLPNIQGDFALVAHGDSMVDAEHPDRSIPSGAIVVLRKIDEAAFIRWGEVYALATRDGFVIKRIMPLDGDNIECHSLNSVDFPPFRVSKSDIFGFARVVAVINYRLY